MTPRIYADHNATTPLCSEAKAAMVSAMEQWGNPSSAHQLGREAAAVVRVAREAVAKSCGVVANSVVFTSGGSEANSLALLGKFLSGPDFSLITSTVEHSSVQGSAAFLSERARVIHATVDSKGQLDLDSLKRQIALQKPVMVSLMAANNETGVLFPTSEIAALCREHGVLFHTDAVQAFGKVACDHWNGADLVTVSAHKIQGPKGVGALLVRPGVQLSPLHYGGSQEIKRRGGTENILGIVGFAAAAAAIKPVELSAPKLANLRDHFENRLLAGSDAVRIQGQGAPRMGNTSNVRFEGISSEVLLSAMDLDGVSLSAGSACSAGSIRPSHVLIAMGLSTEEARQCLRVSFGDSNTSDEVDRVADLMIDHVRRIRSRVHRSPASVARAISI